MTSSTLPSGETTKVIRRLIRTTGQSTPNFPLMVRSASPRSGKSMFSLRANSHCTSGRSTETPTSSAPSARMRAWLSRKWRISSVHPEVKALGKKKSTRRRPR